MIKISTYVLVCIFFLSGRIFSQQENLPTQSNSFIIVSDDLLKVSKTNQLDIRLALSKLNEVNLIYPQSFVGFIALKLYQDFLHMGLNVNITSLHKSQFVLIAFAKEYIKSRVPELLQDFDTEKYLVEKFPDINTDQVKVIIKLLSDRSLDEKYIEKQFNEEFRILQNPVMPEPLNLKEVLSELEYPENARKSKIEDKVTVTLIVNKNGNFEKISSYEGNLIFEDEVKKMVKKLKFKPGKIFGEPAVMSVKIPINFKLSGKK